MLNFKESDRSRSKAKKDNGSKESSTTEHKKPENSVNDKTKSETGDVKSDIKVKTLEEILREKALKNLHERTAQKKAAKLLADKNNKESSDDCSEPIIKSVVSVSKAEATSSQKTDESRESDDEVEFVREKKVRSPKTIILDILDPDDEVASSSKKPTVDIENKDKIPENEAKEETNNDIQDKQSSVLTKIKVKTFQEIMEEKRQRKAQQNKEFTTENNEFTSKEQETNKEDSKTDAKLSRKIRVVKKEEPQKETMATGKIVVKRKVQTKSKLGMISIGRYCVISIFVQRLLFN